MKVVLFASTLQFYLKCILVFTYSFLPLLPAVNGIQMSKSFMDPENRNENFMCLCKTKKLTEEKNKTKPIKQHF